MIDKDKSLVPLQRDAVSIVGKQLGITKKVLEKALTQHQVMDSDAYIERGNLLLSYFISDFCSDTGLEALENYNKAIEIAPENANAYHNRGHMSFLLGDKQKAIEDFNTAIKIDPLLYVSYFMRGQVYDVIGDKLKAIEDFNMTIEIYPNFSMAASLYYFRGSANLYLGNKHQGIEDWKKAATLGFGSAGMRLDRLGIKWRQCEE